MSKEAHDGAVRAFIAGEASLEAIVYEYWLRLNSPEYFSSEMSYAERLEYASKLLLKNQDDTGTSHTVIDKDNQSDANKRERKKKNNKKNYYSEAFDCVLDSDGNQHLIQIVPNLPPVRARPIDTDPVMMMDDSLSFCAAAMELCGAKQHHCAEEPSYPMMVIDDHDHDHDHASTVFDTSTAFHDEEDDDLVYCGECDCSYAYSDDSDDYNAMLDQLWLETLDEQLSFETMDEVAVDQLTLSTKGTLVET
jgi:hypothetical protein